MGKQELGPLWTQIIGNLVLIPIAIWGFHYLFELRFGQFRLALVAVSTEPEPLPSPTPAVEPDASSVLTEATSDASEPSPRRD